MKQRPKFGGGLNEDRYGAIVEREANRYDEQYGKWLDPLRSADIFVISGKQFNEHDAFYVGSMLENFQLMYEAMIHETGSASDLGVLPNLAFDVISSQYGLGVASLLASHQPIDEETGNVYFKELLFETTKASASVTKGDNYLKSDQGMASGSYKKMMDFGATLIENEDTGTNTATGTAQYTVTASNLPLRKSKVTCIIDTLSFVDDGSGNMIGSAGGGTVNYTNGQVVINLTDDTNDGNDILLTYEIDLELADDLPTIGTQYTSKSVNAHVAAFKGLHQTLKAYSMQKRFGKVLEDEIVQDLSEAMAAASSTRVIETIKSAFTAGGATAKTFTKINPAVGSIEEKRYRQGLSIAIEEANLDLNYRSGNGSINRMVVGKNMASFLLDQDSFVKVAFDETLGPKLLGTFGTITVVYSPDQIGDDDAICLYNSPNSPFKSAVVKATYMPMFMTEMRPHAKNPLVSQRAVAEWSAYETLVPRYTHKVSLT